MTQGFAITDMKDGVVEKFTYEGAEFVRKEGEASVGDYLVYESFDDTFIIANKPYEVIEVADLPGIIDEDGDRIFVSGSWVTNIFTKVEAPLSRNPVVGDYVVFTDEDDLPQDTTEGKRYKITGFDSFNDPEFYDDVDDLVSPSPSAHPYEYFAGEAEESEPVEKIAETETIIFEGKTYENIGEVKTQPGDLVRFYEEHSRTTAGKLYVVLERDRYENNDGDTLYSTKGWGGIDKREVFRLIEAQETEVKREAKVGDRIKIVAATWNCDNYDDGDIGTVTKALKTGLFVDLNGGNYGVFHREYVVLDEAETQTDEVIIHEGATYQRVNRRAQAGDVVVFTEDLLDITGGKAYEIKNGDIFFDDENDERETYHNGHSRTNRNETNTKVYEPISKSSDNVLTYRDSSGAIQTVIGAELIGYKAAPTKGDE